MAAHLIRIGYQEEYAGAALRLLPDWVEWCIERSGLDEAAATAVSKWKFDPAKKAGQPVAVQLNIEVNFRLR